MANSTATTPESLSRQVFLYVAMGGAAFVAAVVMVMLFMK